MTVTDWDCDWWDPECPWHGLHTLLDPLRVPLFWSWLGTLGPFPRVVDVGAGSGFVSAGLAARGATMVGIDPSGRAPVLGVGERLPLATGSVDAVVLSEVLEHVDEWRKLVEEAVRVTRPGGRILFSGPNRTVVSWLLLIVAAQHLPLTRVLPPDLHRWRRFVRPPELSSSLHGCGARVRELWGIVLPVSRWPAALGTWAALRRGRITYAEAGDRLQLRAGRGRAVAYVGMAERS